MKLVSIFFSWAGNWHGSYAGRQEVFGTWRGVPVAYPWRTGTDTAISLTKSENGQQRSVNATQYERVSRDDVKRRL